MKEPEKLLGGFPSARDVKVGIGPSSAAAFMAIG
jgi:hypothetical protein